MKSVKKGNKKRVKKDKEATGAKAVSRVVSVTPDKFVKPPEAFMMFKNHVQATFPFLPVSQIFLTRRGQIINLGFTY